jgi:hypothetical protein
MTIHPPLVDGGPIHNRREDQLEPTIYRFCVRGRLTERLAMALEGMTLSPGTVDSTFTGEIKDQSQLFGLLDRISDLGLELVSVQPQNEIDETDHDPTRGSAKRSSSLARPDRSDH